MLKVCIVLFISQLLVSSVLTEQNKQKNDSLYFKFQQNDYDIVFEWAEVVRVTKPEVQQYEIHVFKYNRTCPAGNLTYTYNIDVNNELELIIQAYKFASNEYRQFPVHFQINYCLGIAHNLIGGAGITKCGNTTTCNIKKGITYHICNFIPDQSKYPPFIPTGRYMIEVQGIFRNKEMFVARGYGAVTRSILRNP